MSFAWAGEVEPCAGHYYALRGPTLLVEYDNVQDNANHAHTVWRDLRNDWSVDLLAEHYRPPGTTLDRAWLTDGVLTRPDDRPQARLGLEQILADPGGALAAFDYDGTLAPIVDDPAHAVAHPAGDRCAGGAVRACRPGRHRRRGVRRRWRWSSAALRASARADGACRRRPLRAGALGRRSDRVTRPAAAGRRCRRTG